MGNEVMRAKIDNDEAAAKRVPPLTRNVDMGGNQQDERFTFGRYLPSSADDMGNRSPHRYDRSTAAHFLRHTPDRVLARAAETRALLDRIDELEAQLKPKTDRETIIEILDRAGIGYTRAAEDELQMRSIEFRVPVDHDERDAKKIQGYVDFFAVLAIDETETLGHVEVWE